MQPIKSPENRPENRPENSKCFCCNGPVGGHCLLLKGNPCCRSCWEKYFNPLRDKLPDPSVAVTSGILKAVAILLLMASVAVLVKTFLERLSGQ